MGDSENNLIGLVKSHDLSHALLVRLEGVGMDVG